MNTPCELTVKECTLTIVYDGMSMGMPTRATIEGSELTFNSSGTVDGCVGTVMSPSEILGTCEGGSCTFVLER